MNLFVPLSVGAGALTQLVVLKSLFCCKANPVEGDGQETSTVFVAVNSMLKHGGAGTEYKPTRPSPRPTSRSLS